MRSPSRRRDMAYFLPTEGSSSCGRSATGGSESGRSRSRRLSRSLRTLSCRGVRTPYMTTTRRGNSVLLGSVFHRRTGCGEAQKGCQREFQISVHNAMRFNILNAKIRIFRTRRKNMPKSFESQCFLFYFAEHINTLILYFYDR